MATAKLVLRKEILNDGTSPLAIRITKDRKSSYKYLGKSVHTKDWDAIQSKVKKSHSNSARLNNYLLQKMAEINNTVLTVETKVGISAKQINTEIHLNKNQITLFAIAEAFLKNFESAGKYNRLKPDGSRIAVLKKYLSNKNIPFTEITPLFLKRYIAYLKGSLKNSDRTITNHLILIRSLFNLAIKHQPGLKEHYPFGREGIQIRIPKTIKIGLVVDEVRKLEEFNPAIGSILRHARNFWLMSFYFAGIRASDVLRLRWSDFQDDRLYYKMGKNAKADSLAVSEKVKAILTEYHDQRLSSDDFIFPELKSINDVRDNFIMERKIAHSIHRLNKYLAQISDTLGFEKKVTTHIARHTFGNISGDKISIQMLQKLYRHSSITTTIGYQANFIHKDADDALSSVIHF